MHRSRPGLNYPDARDPVVDFAAREMYTIWRRKTICLQRLVGPDLRDSCGGEGVVMLVRRCGWFGLALILVLSPVLASAQNVAVAQLSGTVTDETGGGVP